MENYGERVINERSCLSTLDETRKTSVNSFFFLSPSSISDLAPLAFDSVLFRWWIYIYIYTTNRILLSSSICDNGSLSSTRGISTFGNGGMKWNQTLRRNLHIRRFAVMQRLTGESFPRYGITEGNIVRWWSFGGGREGKIVPVLWLRIKSVLKRR